MGLPEDQYIQYTSFNKIKKINEGLLQQIFTYGFDQQRRKSYLYNNNTLEKTITHVGDYEKIEIGTDTYEVHYIGCGEGLVAMFSEDFRFISDNAMNLLTEHIPIISCNCRNSSGNVRTNGGADEIYYTYTDHLGSILTVTDENANIVHDQSFDAWGKRRNAVDWTYDNVDPAPPWLIRGYTYHEHMDEFNLINMNGRVYDPVVSRMLSTDNYVQEPGYSQSYNRYSYVWNNPLKYTDPSGEFALEAFITGFADGFFSKGSNRFSNAWQEGTHRGVNSLKITGGLFASDPDKNFWGRSWEILSRLTWQSAQTGLGLAYSQIENNWGGVESVEYFHGATVVENSYDYLFFGKGGRGIALGSFINVENNADLDLKEHEYGHYLQSQFAGPLYLTSYGFPSLATGQSFGYQGVHSSLWVEQDAETRSHAYFSTDPNVKYKATNFKSTNPKWYEYALFFLTPHWSPEQVVTGFMLNRYSPSP